MIESAVWKKLGVKPGGRLRVLRLPAGVELALAPLPEGAQRVARGRGDVVLAFFEDRAAVARHFEAARAALAEGGALWLAYPKKRAQKKTAEKRRGQAAGGIASDLGRDVGWEPVTAAGWTGVAQIALDSIWSAVRFRPAALVAAARARRPASAPASAAAPPDALEAALEKSAAARRTWRSLAPSHVKEYVRWIVEAKRPETRSRRIAETIALLEGGQRGRNARHRG
jgi:hypothetical protein